MILDYQESRIIGVGPSTWSLTYTEGMALPDAYLVGLELLARRELSEAQLRSRLARRQFGGADIDTAVERLSHERALDDRRMALSCARREVLVRRRGRIRVLRHIEALGIASETARSAVDEVFDEVDETMLLEQALDRRLERGLTLDDPAMVRRMHRHLIAQGFDPGHVAMLLRRRARGVVVEY
jgi:regulatory protein